MLKQVSATISGDVTRVGYRGWIRMKARQLHVTGYIRNVYHKSDVHGPHGGVEAVLQGQEEAVKDMLEYLREGSPMSRVDVLNFHYEEPTEVFEDFVVLKSESFARNT